jgi:CRP-like cAMP-binding protein
MARCLRVKIVPRGAFVFLAGEPSRHLSLLAEGTVKVVHETEEAHEVILRQIDPGEIFGSAGGGARTCSQPVRALRMTRSSSNSGPEHYRAASRGARFRARG